MAIRYINRRRQCQQMFVHTSNTGSTVTGLIDAFHSFWFFGAIKFFVIGFIMGRWWRPASGKPRRSDGADPVRWRESAGDYSHQTPLFFPVLLTSVPSLLPALHCARVPRHGREIRAPAQAENAV